jgi:hypothetical protein
MESSLDHGTRESPRCLGHTQTGAEARRVWRRHLLDLPNYGSSYLCLCIWDAEETVLVDPGQPSQQAAETIGCRRSSGLDEEAGTSSLFGGGWFGTYKLKEVLAGVAKSQAIHTQGLDDVW